MSIHDFHLQLVSGKDESRLIQALRRLRKAESLTALMSGEEAAMWSMWNEKSEDGGSLTVALA